MSHWSYVKFKIISSGNFVLFQTRFFNFFINIQENICFTKMKSISTNYHCEPVSALQMGIYGKWNIIELVNKLNTQLLNLYSHYCYFFLYYWIIIYKPAFHNAWLVQYLRRGNGLARTGSPRADGIKNKYR